jgi:hypothetical protein
VVRPDSFGVNEFLSSFDQLTLESGYRLDYVCFNYNLWGMVVIYACPNDEGVLDTYESFLESEGEEDVIERSFKPPFFVYEYLDKVHIKDTLEGYYQFSSLSLIEDDFFAGMVIIMMS